MDKMIFIPKILEDTGLVKVGFSTRFTGVGVDKKLIDFKKICDVVGVDYKNLITLNQTHSTNCKNVSKTDVGRRFDNTDGLITNEKYVPLSVFYADCMPILLLDTKNKVISAVHSGWRGTLDNIAKVAVEQLKRDFNTNVEDLKIAIGPSISKESFVVDSDVATDFREKYGDKFVQIAGEKFTVDLWGVVRSELEKLGVLSSNIEVLGVCTVKNTDICYSFRKEGEKAGRMVAVIELI